MATQAQIEKMRTGGGFIAALDQSGGSTPKALKLYGISEDAYAPAEMFDVMHAMRTRIMTSPTFNADGIIGAILFENTLDRAVEGKPTPTYLLDKGILPFLKVDAGLADSHNDVQLMKPIPNLQTLLDKAVDAHVFGTKMRSVIKGANERGIKDVVAQQFEIAKQIISKGLVPIIEPEVDINISDKQAAEHLLKAELEAALAKLEPTDNVIFKLTLPAEDNFYAALLQNPHVVRIVALSGGYSQKDANAKLAQNRGVIASFSRALTEGLNANQTDDAFNAVLGDSIKAIAAASNV